MRSPRDTTLEPAVGLGGGVGGGNARIDWFQLLTNVMGGIALLNFALSRIACALRGALGGGLRDAIRRATRTRVRAFATGAAVTALLSSATASSLLVLGFVQSGDMSLDEALAIGLGVGVGSTLNAHLLAFSPHRYAMAAVAVGYALMGRAGGGGGSGGGRGGGEGGGGGGLLRLPAGLAPAVGIAGEALLGLGLLFFSAAIVSSALAPLRGHAPFLAFLGHLRRPALAMPVAALVAVAFQSSNTVVMLAVSLAQQGLLSPALGVYLVVGANVGTAVTPVLAALGAPRAALRVALALLALRLLGCAALLPLLARFVEAVQWSTLGVQSSAEDSAYDVMVDRGRMRNDASLDVHDVVQAMGLRAVLPLQVANAHTLFNAWCALVALPCLPRVARAVTWLLPDADALPLSAGAGPGGKAKRRGSVEGAGKAEDERH